ncbi:MAG: beta-galactosidase [bacterium]
MNYKSAIYASALFFCVVLNLIHTAIADVPDVNWSVNRHPSEEELTSKTKKLAHLVEQIESLGLDASYARSALVLAKDFIVYAKEDETNGRAGRARYVRGWLDEALDRAIAEAQALLEDPSRNRPIPRPPLHDIIIRNGAFLAGDTQIMFGGVGHFDKVRQDIPKFSDYGFNLIQIEIGPNSVVTGPEPHEVRSDLITERVVKHLDRAAEHNVMVNLLLSPHYFPQWAMDSYPEVKECGRGFIQYCISAPRARNILQRYLEVLIPMVKDKPALQSYTLANEPQFSERNADTLNLFRNHLKQKYGQISRLNHAWNIKYRDFNQVHLTDDLLFLNPAARYDWVQFHNSIGTEFFRWMKDVIRTMDSRTPIHIKIMDNMFENEETLWGIDREALYQFTEISGNDSHVRFPSIIEGYALRYHKNAAFFDFLKSIQPEKPIQNSENHIIADDSPLFYSEEYIHAALWIQYLHGMAASTIWVWERSDDTSLGNNILSRPNCVYAATRTTLDVRRLAPYVTALANAITASPIALYYSQTTRILQMNIIDKWNAAYELALYHGHPVRMVTDSTVMAGLDPQKVRTLIIPEFIYTTDELYGQLVDFVKRGGHVVTLGQCFRMTPQNIPRDTSTWEQLKCGSVRGYDAGCVEILSYPDSSVRRQSFLKLHSLMMDGFGVPRPEIELMDADGEPILGVEYRSTFYNGKRIAYIFNALDRPVALRLRTRDGSWATTRDLINGREITQNLELAPLEIVLFIF